jgi:hypothetical protein
LREPLTKRVPIVRFFRWARLIGIDAKAGQPVVVTGYRCLDASKKTLSGAGKFVSR